LLAAYGRAITGDLCGYEKRQPDSQGYEVTSGADIVLQRLIGDKGHQPAASSASSRRR
jgi:hypothetical protein